uniref:Glutaminyl-peptide cyclotransferase n=1 Tax=Conus frigidus TaxID=101755 RepID=A0A2D1P886_CONFG|nr:glutaminyl cyclase [Conus frigidus]
MMEKVTTAATYVRLLLLCSAVASNRALQNLGCGSLTSQYTVDNLSNLTVGMSDDGLRKKALPPLLKPRVSGTRGNFNVRNSIIKWMRREGWSVQEDPFIAKTPYGWVRFSNVIATLNPRAARRVVLACHYDSKLILFHGLSFVGATDSAVPCALLMDSAKKLRQVFQEKVADASFQELTLQFIFFDGEEAYVQWSRSDSLYGARHLAQKWASTPDPTAAGLNYLQTIGVFILLDLIGSADTRFANLFNQTAGVYAKLQSIEMCLTENGYLDATANPLPLFTSEQKQGTIEDDHLPFLRRGVPVVHLISTPFPSVWHKLSDNLHALDFQRTENLARILRLFLVDLL